MLEKRIMLALNGADDAFLDETALTLGYINEAGESTVPLNIYRKSRYRRLVSILVAACLLISLGIMAYAADLFGIRALLIKSDDLPAARNEDGGHLSITQPQEVPEEMSADIKAKIENSTKAWNEWDAWRKTNGLHLPDNCIPPENVSSADYVENEDGSWTITYYEGAADADKQKIETRTITAEEYAAEQEYWNARAIGFDSYDFKYHVYSQEMADKLEEIAAKFGLELRRERTAMYENFDGSTQFNSFDEITARINQVCADGNNFFRVEPTGYDKFYYYGEGTFAICFYTTEDKTNTGTSCYLYNSPYGTLSSGFEIVGEIQDVGAMSAYTHTTPDGTELTVLHNGADMFAYVYLEKSFVTMSFNQPDGLSTEEINSIIDMVDFSAIK